MIPVALISAIGGSGLTATFTGDINLLAPEANAAALPRPVEPRAKVLNVGGSSTVDTFAVSNFCAEVEEEAGLEPGECTAAAFTRIRLDRVCYDHDDDNGTPCGLTQEPSSAATGFSARKPEGCKRFAAGGKRLGRTVVNSI
jgi:hypothetical protein